MVHQAPVPDRSSALNRTRQVYLAKELRIAGTHWSRFRGLIGTTRDQFREGGGLWIVPCHGVHTLGMRFPIDVVYLDREHTVIYLQQNLPPWRFAALRIRAASVLELPENTVQATGTAVGDRIEIVMSRTREIAPA